MLMAVIILLLAIGFAFRVIGTEARPKIPPTDWTVAKTPLDRPAEALRNDTAEHVTRANEARSQLIQSGDRSTESTLQLYNAMVMHLDAAMNECGLFARIHPNAEIRSAAEEGEQAVARVVTEINLDRDLYMVFQHLDLNKLEADGKWFVEKRLRDFRRAGVDQSDEVRKRIAVLNEEIIELGQTFARNIRDDEREILLDSAADLSGLPDDWIAKHKPGQDGKIRISTRTPDYGPFMTYATSAPARRDLFIQHKERAYPTNLNVLQQLIIRRNELAQLLGYPNWAEYVTEDKMISTAGNAQSFIDRVAGICKTAAIRDYQQLLNRKRNDFQQATGVEDWEKAFYEERVKAEQFAFDSQSVRPYFNMPQVLKGLFDLTSQLFGVSYRRVDGLQLWHADVSAWDIFDGGNQIGRFYLDLHPRDGKYGHAAQFDYRAGVAGNRLPQSVLVCNFPNPSASNNGVALLEHGDVVTLFHEFGHLLHALFAGHQKWIGNSGISTEWDFVEVPSQMLEEWCFDAAALQTFATHHQTGEPIPMDLVRKLCAARDFGNGLHAAHQMFYAAVSLNYYRDENPTSLDTTQLMIDLQKRYSPFAYLEGTHFQCNFGHLDGYTAIYYTYMWSLVIAKDLLSVFQREGLLNRKVAMKYRKAILEPGGSKKASELIAEFLGREYSFDAFNKWLNA